MSGTTTLSDNVYINASKPNPGSTLDVEETSTATFYTLLNCLQLSGCDISRYQNVPNNDLVFHTNFGVQLQTEAFCYAHEQW